jgi:pSer/pThr/pTyr-binding forkhead associated (FHA) protein
MLPAMSVPVSGPPAHHWEVTISIDPSLRQPASPEPPAGIAPVTVALEAPVNLIGRKSEAQAIFPEISLPYDEAVSHRHALLQLNDRGTLLLRDIGASNGTQLNGKEIVAMQDYPIQDGDQILLGHWSRISVKAISDKAIQ